MKNWRKLTWFILVVQALFIIWIISGISNASSNCDGMTGSDLDLCQAGTAIGAGLGVGLIIFLWAFIDIVLGLIWLITNRGQRDCPQCGKAVKKGATKCKSCGYDYVKTA